ncbi:MAG: prepilin peptidase [Alphaproteobacteria bacterium]|nr:prepilin peptidase [Alphaproteobacteria bacterium]
MLLAAITVIFPLCLAYAAFSDMFTMTIPNRVSVILIVSFALIAPFTGMDWIVFAKHFAAALLVFSVCFALFGIGVMGGGDAKLLTATSLWFGLSMQLFAFLTYVALIGGLLTLMILLARSDRFSVVVNRVGIISHLTDSKLGVPYGVAIAVAGFICFPASSMVQYALAHLV